MVASIQPILILTSNPSQFPRFGDAITFVATITPVGVTGTVQFIIDGIGGKYSSPVNASTGIATITISDLLIGNRFIVAMYSGDATYLPVESSPVVGSPNSLIASFLTINQGLTSVSIVNDPISPSVFGQMVNFNVTVHPATSTELTIPTGKVNFFVDTVGNLNNDKPVVAGIATLSIDSLSPGQHTIYGIYTGDANFASGDRRFPLVQIVSKATPTLGLTSSTTTNPSVFGQLVTFTSTIAQPFGTTFPTGTVIFVDTTTGLAIGTSSVSPLGIALITTDLLSIGSHTINATYSGDGNYNSILNHLVQIVTKDPTTIKIKSSVNPSKVGDLVTLTAKVKAVLPGSGIPSGIVTFTINDAIVIPITLISGKAITTFTPAMKGKQKIKAVYSGDTNFIESNTTFKQIVKKNH